MGTWRSRAAWGWALALWLTGWAGGVHAQATPQAIDASLNESVVMVPLPGLFTLTLETTLFKPDGPGPFPVVVINHGKSAGNTKFQARYRPLMAVRYFLERGYVVVVPMRLGFSQSSGSYIGGGCNVESNGRVQADDVRAALDYVVAQPWADRERIVVVGQSHGGWTTLALGADGYPGVKGLVNFAGGLRQETCSGWESVLVRAAGSYGRTTRLPSLWFYGDNDSYFSPTTFRAMFEQYSGAGGPARLVAFGPFGSDAHALFGARAGAAIWQPELTRFLDALGLQAQPLAEYARFAARSAPADPPTPPATGFAPLQDVALVPYLRDSGRDGYRSFLAKPQPRAFAIGANGAWGRADGGEDAQRRALANCNRNAREACRLYAVDDVVVWTAE